MVESVPQYQKLCMNCLGTNPDLRVEKPAAVFGVFRESSNRVISPVSRNQKALKMY